MCPAWFRVRLRPALAAMLNRFFFNSRNDLDLEHNLTVAVAINPGVGATKVAHEMKIIRLKPFAESFVYQCHRGRKLRYQIHTHFAWAEFDDEIAVYIEHEGLADRVTGITVR